jgi:chromosomal replication initiation ATPase DnaA
MMPALPGYTPLVPYALIPAAEMSRIYDRYVARRALRPDFKILHIAACAAELAEIPLALVIGEGRESELFRTRCAIVLLARRRGHSMPKIGRVLGRRDHTTIMNALRRANAMMAKDEGFARFVARLEASL